MAVRTITTKLALDGEAEYKAKIKNINAELSLHKSQLEKVQAQYKDQANSTEALGAKYAALKAQLVDLHKKHTEQEHMLERAQTAYKKYSKEVSELEGRQKKLQNSTEGSAQAEKQLQEELEAARKCLDQASNSVTFYQKQLNYTERDQASLKEQLKQTRSYLDEAESSFNGCATSIDQLGKKGSSAIDALAQAIVAAGLAEKVKDVAAALYGCVETFGAFQSQMSAVQAISGATGEDMAALADKAKEMGATTSFTAEEAGQALEYMAMAGWKTGDMLDGLEGIMHLAAASGEDLASTSDIVTDALTAFGLKASDSGHFADVLAKASSNANTNVAMMGETFKYAAPVAGALGYSIEDVALAVGLMANAGIKGSQSGTALRGMLTNLAKPSDEVAGYMKKLGVSLTDSEGEMRSLSELMGILRDRFSKLTEAQQAEYAAGIAGKEAMSGLLAVVNASEADYRKLAEAIGDCSNASYEMSQTRLDNYAGQVTLLNSAVDGLKLAVGEQLEPVLRNLASGATDAVTGVTELLETCPALVPILSGLVASAGALAAAFAGFHIVKGITPMLTAFNAALAANPAGAVAVGVVGLISALTVLSAQCGNAGAEAQALTKSLKESQSAYEDLSASMEGEHSSVANSIRALEDLLAVEDKSAAQKDIIRRKVEELNEKIPGLSLAYDEAADAINMTNDALERMAESAGNQEEYAAQVERLSELYTEQQALEDELAETKKRLAETMADARWDSFGGAMNDSATAVGQLQEAEAELNAALEEHAGRIAELEESTGALSDQQAAAAEQAREMSLETEAMTVRMESAIQEVESLQAAYEESYASALENIYGQVGLFQEMDGAAKTSVDNLIDTLKGQVSYMETYADNIQKAIEMGVDQGLVQQLSDGSEKSAQILASIVEGGKEDIEELNAQFAKVEEGKQDFAKSVAEMETEFKQKMEAISQDMKAMVKGMNLKEDAYKAGWNNIQGLIDGTASQKRALVEKYAEMGRAALAAYKREVQQASPSKAFQKVGQFDIQGIIGGAAGMKEKLANIYADIAKAAKKGMEENLPSFQLNTENIFYDPSVDYAALMQQARSRAEFDALAAQREAKIAGEKIDLAEKGYADNIQLLEQWNEAVAESAANAQETLSFIRDHVDSEMQQLIESAPGMGQDFVDGLIEGIERNSNALNQSVRRMAKDMQACVDAEFQPVQKHLSGILIGWADSAAAAYREEQSAHNQDLAAALREALSGLSVNMNQRKVGELVTDWQKNNDRSRGV